MGGGARYQYPKDIWSPSGGWWPNPRSWRRNTAIAAAFILLSCIPVGLWAESHIERTPPVRKIPWRPELLTRAEVYALYDEAQAREQAKSPGK